MRLRILGVVGEAPADRRQIERLFRLGLGSWAGRVRRADIWIDALEEDNLGLAFACRIRASLMNWVDVSVQGLGADSLSAVQSATRHLVRQIKRQSMDAPLRSRFTVE